MLAKGRLILPLMIFGKGVNVRRTGLIAAMAAGDKRANDSLNNLVNIVI